MRLTSLVDKASQAAGTLNVARELCSALEDGIRESPATSNETISAQADRLDVDDGTTPKASKLVAAVEDAGCVRE